MKPESNAQSLVQIRGVSKSYDGQQMVIEGLDLEVARGEFLTLLGPSGSGKTTTLMMLAGFEIPSGGEILLNGKNITHMPPHRRGIGVVFQSYALFPHMTIAENVAYPLRVKGVGKAEAAKEVEAALAMVHLAEFGNRRPAQLSGGQQQRVALARALVFKPALVLLDEPLGALDKQLRENMQYELKQLHEALGVTMVYVTHDQSEALTMSDRIALFNEGKIQQIAAPRDIYERPDNLFVAEFIGESNRLTGEYLGLEGDHAVVRLTAGQTLRARPVGGLNPGQRVHVSVRPERMRVGATDDGSNRLASRITGVVYLGDSVRCTLVTEKGEEIVVKMDIERAETELKVGDNVQCSFSANVANIFPAAV